MRRSWLGFEDDSLGSLVWGPAAGGACTSAIVAGLLFLLPGSPLALGNAETQLGQGYADEAATAFLALGVHASDPAVRASSLERAAKVHELERTDREQARRLLKLRLSLGTSPQELARLREEIAESYLGDRDLEAASRQYAAAHDAHPEGDRAPDMLARAAELRTSAEQPGRARSLWRRLMKTHPEHAARANLGLGELALAEGRTTAALRPFQAAAKSSNVNLAKAARLGLAACYERLGELDGALAELDLSSLPFSVRERRKAGLRERANTRGQVTADR
jgi:tetratricopeptide (TPR) repeat protein